MKFTIAALCILTSGLCFTVDDLRMRLSDIEARQLSQQAQCEWANAAVARVQKMQYGVEP
jgi:hypothetical protein